MFLHLGADVVIPLKNVIAITEMKSGESAINNLFLQKMRQEKKTIDIAEDNPQSFIITDNGIYLSAISSLTLKKRASNIADNTAISPTVERRA